MSRNNISETVEQLYHRFGEIKDIKKQQDEIKKYMQNHPLCCLEVNQFSENINQLLFLRQLILQEGFLTVFQKMKK